MPVEKREGGWGEGSGGCGSPRRRGRGGRYEIRKEGEKGRRERGEGGCLAGKGGEGTEGSKVVGVVDGGEEDIIRERELAEAT